MTSVISGFLNCAIVHVGWRFADQIQESRHFSMGIRVYAVKVFERTPVIYLTYRPAESFRIINLDVEV